MASFDARELRNAFGTFLTGVTVVTTVEPSGVPRGFTANSFSSVSLDPPLLLVCIAKTAASLEVFTKAEGFAVNILAESQKEVSGVFASRSPEKFSSVEWRAGPAGNPLLAGVTAWFDCVRHDVVDAGDHVILVGRVLEFDHCDANPLGYARGAYFSLGLEQAAVTAAGSEARTVVGAILERDGAVLLLPDANSGGLRLPESGRAGASGSVASLRDTIAREGVQATIGFLFAVFENPNTGVQSIFYRGEASAGEPSEGSFVPLAELPWERLSDEATRTMLRRYLEERRQDSFGIYLGDEDAGEVRSLHPETHENR